MATATGLVTGAHAAYLGGRVIIGLGSPTHWSGSQAVGLLPHPGAAKPQRGSEQWRSYQALPTASAEHIS
jgi:hypothetical protein